MNKTVILPPWLYDGIQPLKNSYPENSNLIVFDTETESRETGEPYLLNFYDGNSTSYLRVNKETILKCFTEYLNAHCPKARSNILFAHNLEFDIGAVLCDEWEEVFRWRKPPLIEVQDDNGNVVAEIQLYPQKTWFAQIRLENGAYVKVVDTALSLIHI